jgi:hypothetical protein
VFAVAVFVCYSWSLFGFFNKFSSFILYFTLAEIGNIFAFIMTFALLESLTATGIVVLLSAILPSAWLRDEFAFKGSVFLAVATAASILFQKILSGHYPSVLALVLCFTSPFVLIAFLIYWIPSKPRLQNLLLNIQDRLLIMLFFYVPIGIISMIVVLYRNLL